MSCSYPGLRYLITDWSEYGKIDHLQALKYSITGLYFAHCLFFGVFLGTNLGLNLPSALQWKVMKPSYFKLLIPFSTLVKFSLRVQKSEREEGKGRGRRHRHNAVQLP